MYKHHISIASCLACCFIANPIAHAHDSDDVAAALCRHVPDGDRAQRAEAREEICREDPRVLLGQISQEACVGAELFFRESFDGNGRTCGSCHPAQNNYTLDAEYIAQLPDSDPLFVAEQVPELHDLEIPSLLREFALIVVNPDGFEDPTHKFTVRSVPHMLGLATSTTPPPLDDDGTQTAFDGTTVPPLERLGWSGDGAPGQGELRDFADGAIRQHMTRSLKREAGIDFSLPSDHERDAMAAFSRSIGRTNDVVMSHVALKDTAADRGRITFMSGNGRECAIDCHFDAGANAAIDVDVQGVPNGLINLSRDIGTAVVRLPQVKALGVPLDGGYGLRPLDLDFDGVLDSFGNGAMNVPPLIEAADTGPMFSTNASATLEDAIKFYASDGFAHSFTGKSLEFDNRKKGDPIPLSDTDVSDVGRFLRVVNAALNAQMARYRAQATTQITEHFGQQHQDVQRGLIVLAVAELDDALQVLTAVKSLAVPQQKMLIQARDQLRKATRVDADCAARIKLLQRVCTQLDGVVAGLGSGLEMDIGASTLLF